MSTSVALGVALVIATTAYAAFTFFMYLLMSRQTRLQVFQIMIERMEQTRGDRRRLRDYLATEKADAPLPNDVREAADRVCRHFDILALADRTGLIDRRLVDSFYSVPLVDLYERILARYVEDLRKPENRGPTCFWELVQFYERVRHVPKDHPGTTGKAKWPRHPRVSHDR